MKNFTLAKTGLLFLLSLVMVVPAYAQIFTSNGSAGTLTVSATQTINSYYAVTAISGNQITYQGSYSPHVGDKLLIIQMTGAHTGDWQWDSVMTIGNPLTVSGIYRNFDTTHGGLIQIVTVPQYHDVHITPTGVLTALPWNGSTGGILTMLVQDTLRIDSGGKCNVNGLGFFPAADSISTGAGGAGGIGGIGGGIGQNGGDSLLVTEPTATFGGLYGMDGSRGHGIISPVCPGCDSITSTNLSLYIDSNIIVSTFVLGGAGAGGVGGAGGLGAGGGGGGTGAGATPGTAGGIGGTGGMGGRGGNGGGLIMFASSYLLIPAHDTVFTATGNAGDSALAGGTGAQGGQGGNAAGCGSAGGGGAGGEGGNGGNGGNGGGGGIVFGVLFHTSLFFDSAYLSTGGAGGKGAAGGPGGPGGLDGYANGGSCGSGPNGAAGTPGNNGSPGNDGGGGSSNAGGGGGGTTVIVTPDCNTHPIENNFTGAAPGYGCPTTGYTGDIELHTYGGDSIFSYAAVLDNLSPTSTNYSIEVVDGAGCSAHFNYIIIAPVTTAPGANITITPACSGSSDGQINVYSFQPGVDNCITFTTYNNITDSSGNYLGSDNVSGLAPGTYFVYYGFTPDADSMFSIVTVPADTPVTITLDSIVTPTCANIYGGSINLSITGGMSCLSGNYYVSWTDVNGYNVGYGLPDLTNVIPGTYTATIMYDGYYSCGSENISTNYDCIQTVTYTIPYPTTLPVAGYEYDTVCSGNGYSWNNAYYTQSGAYTDTLIAAGGCDSIATIYLTVLDPIIGASVSPQYYGDNCGIPFNLYNDVITGGDGNYSINPVAGNPTCALSPVTGQDVPYTVYITDGHGCQGQYTTDVYYVDDQYDFVYVNATNTSCPNSSDGTYTGQVTDYTLQECNPTWTLTISGSSTSYYYQTSGTQTNNITITGLPADQFMYTISGGDQCSQAMTGYFSIFSNNNTASGSEYDTICSGGSFTWYGNTYTQAGVYSYTIPGGSVSGCDSMTNLNLSIDQPITATNTVETFGDGCLQGFDPALITYSGGDGIYNLNPLLNNTTCSSGTNIEFWTVVVTDGAGCSANIDAYGNYVDDQLDFLSYTQTNTSCPNANDGTYTGTIYDYTNLQCFPGYSLNVAGPNNYAYSSGSSQVNTNLTLTNLTAGQYTYNIIGNGACSQPASGTFTIYGNTTPVSGAEYDTVCTGTPFIWNGITYTQSGIYTDTLYGASTYGCDSTATLSLVISQSVTAAVYDTLCSGQSYQLGGSSYTSSGIYSATLTSFTGCDSTVTLYLMVNNAITSAVYDTICSGQSYQLGGSSYTSSGIYSVTLTNVTGCDSTVTLNLLVNLSPSVNLYDTLVLGDTLYIAGQGYTQSGVYTDTFASAYSCDSVVTLYLLVESSATFVNLFDTICQGFSIDLDGHSYTVSGTYLDTIRGTLADTVVTLHLVVDQALLSNVYDTICEGASVIAGSHTYTQSGIYVDTLSSVYRCDSVRALHLTVVPSVTPTISISVSHGPQAGGMQTDTFTAIYTDCPNPYYSWYEGIVPLGIHTAIAVVTLPVGTADSILCGINCDNECAVASHVYSNSIYTGISHITSIQGVNIYPNPTHGSFTMDINVQSIYSNEAQVAVTDLLGQSVLNNAFILHPGDNRQTITLAENTVSGIYIIQLSVDGQSLYYRLVLDK